MSIKAGAGLSRLPDSRKAVREVIPEAMAEAGLDRAEWAACFFSMAHQPQAEMLREVILRETGCRAFFGCSAAGLIGGAEEVEAGPGLVLMVGSGSGIQVRSAMLTQEAEGLAGLVPADIKEGDESLLFLLPDAYRVDAAVLLAKVRSEWPGLSLYGAGATDNGTTGWSLQMSMEGVSSNAVAALSISGELDYAVGITQSCAPVGDPHFITAARDNVILELDGRPAIHVYMEQGEALRLDDFQQLVGEVLLGFPLESVNPSFNGESCLVRHLVGFDQQSGGLVVPQQLEGQGAMVFMHRNPEAAEQDMRRMAARLKKRFAGPPDFGFYFDCAARGQRLYGREGVDARVIREEIGEFPLIGMLGGFELATSSGRPLMYTYTGVLVLIRGRAA